MQYKNLGAYSINCSDKKYPYLYFTDQYNPENAPVIDTDQPVLVGCFENEQGKKGYIIVNGTELEADKTVELKINFGASSEITAYPFGTAKTLTPDADGNVTLVLESGQGVFVTVD